jgi:predicted DNA-binding transcriptional regulator AlpA
MEKKNLARALPLQAAANYLGLAVSTLNKLRCTGGGPVFLKLGRSVRYSPDDLEDWLAARRVNSTSELALRERIEKI